MKRRTAIGGFLFMGVMMAMASLALVYANWSEELNINASVQTGELDTNISIFRVEDKEGDKDIGQCAAEVTGGGSKVAVTITNAYPGYACNVLTDINNKTKIPVTVLPGEPELGGDTSDKGAPLALLPNCTGAKQVLQGGFAVCDFQIQVTKAALQDQSYTIRIPICTYLAVNLAPGFSQEHKCGFNDTP